MKNRVSMVYHWIGDWVMVASAAVVATFGFVVSARVIDKLLTKKSKLD